MRGGLLPAEQLVRPGVVYGMQAAEVEEADGSAASLETPAAHSPGAAAEERLSDLPGDAADTVSAGAEHPSPQAVTLFPQKKSLVCRCRACKCL
jgi:hypothetical protein